MKLEPITADFEREAGLHINPHTGEAHRQANIHTYTYISVHFRVTTSLCVVFELLEETPTPPKETHTGTCRTCRTKKGHHQPVGSNQEPSQNHLKEVYTSVCMN